MQNQVWETDKVFGTVVAITSDWLFLELVAVSGVRLLTGTDRNGPNNRNGPGITGTDLTCYVTFSIQFGTKGC